ncbi:hypothetical protein ACFY7C_02050 [Streptomyces sp. NPDC012769]|uniref:hypothetical protein n=1 Tax=Streptomyces sp. NPDC012769 TaxID=3364848 RepID=UPI003676DE3A
MEKVRASTADTTVEAAARQARYGNLPERIRFEDMTEVTEGAPNAAASSYDPEGAWKFGSCLALELGL